MIGRTLGNYRIIEQIGMGGMATVYEAYDPGTDRHVAIKILPRQFSKDPTFRERFRREAKAIAKLEHLHILPIFAYGEEDDIAYMAMRCLKTGTLTDRIKQGPLPLKEAGHLLNQIASGLDYAHEHNILHRDVKPSNILLDASGNAFLTYFGIAKIVESALDLTGGGILGTPAYMSPEQCMGETDLTAASDIYSLGIVLYEMVTGRTPFQAETPIALIHMQLSEPLPIPHHLRADLPEAAERVILKALAKEPEARYQICREMAAAFAQAVAGEPVADIPTPPVDTPATPILPDSLPDDKATSAHEPAGKTVAASPPPRAVPRWLWPVIIVALIGIGAVGAALFSFDKNSMNNQADQTSSAESSGSMAAAVAATPTTQSDSPAQIAPSTADFLPEERWIEPCLFEDLGSGLCIFPAQGGSPTKILQTQILNISPVSCRGALMGNRSSFPLWRKAPLAKISISPAPTGAI